MDEVEEIKQRLGVDEVLANYIQLKPAGRNFKALCPFHHEKTPSFIVSPDKEIWHCFGCGEGGDIYEFVMKMEGLDFRGALEQLARTAGVELKGRGSSGNRELRERLFKINEWAAKYYHAALAKHTSALDYLLKERKFTKPTIREFTLGFAPASGDKLVKFLQSKNFKTADVIKAGLAREKNGRSYDLFRERIMVPLRDGAGRTVGFTGRVTPANADRGGPKYINTPQTRLYDKSQVLFGLHLAKEAIREAKETVVVEGNFDVISSHQAGVKNVVAASGTALTAAQIKSLSRLSKTVKLAFDADSAGLAATERTIPLAAAAGVHLYIVLLRDAKDPDELIGRDVKEWKQAIKEAPYVMDWLLKNLTKSYDLTSATGKKEASDRFAATLAKISDPVEQDHYVRQLAAAVNVSPASIERKLENLKQTKSTPPARDAAYQSETVVRNESDIVQEALLALTVAFADTRTSLQDVKPDYFTSEDRRLLHEQLLSSGDSSWQDNLPAGLKSIANYVKILLLRGEAHYQDWPAVDRRIEAFSLAQRLAGINIKKRKNELSEQIRAAEASGDREQVQKLLEEYQTLVKSH